MQRAAIVGAGPGGLIGYTTLRYRGLVADEITVFDEHPAPLTAWTRSTAAIRQEAMRSESEGHCFPTDFPGFALMDALHRGSPAPLVRSIFNRYHPSLQSVLQHGQALARHFEMDRSIHPVRIERITRQEEPEPHFALHDGDGAVIGRAQHVLLALGHGKPRWPAALQDASTRAQLHDLVYHAYQPKPYDGRTAVVVGAGMAAASEWVNVLRAGGTVLAVRRRAALETQPLSAPRCAFGGPWLDRYHRLDRTERVAVLAELGHGTFPEPAAWKRTLDEGVRSGRLQHHVGEVERIERNGEECLVTLCEPEGSRIYRTGMVVAATGFAGGWREYDLLRGLVAEYALETEAGDLILANDCSIPALSRSGSILAVSGAPARWAFPAADSFAGMKYAARRFAEHALASEGRGRPQLGAWYRMVRGGWPYGGTEAWEPCATP